MVRGLWSMIVWRKTIFERDDYTCQMCGKRGDRLNADHYPKALSELISEHKIRSYSDARNCSELWDINNGRTLCVPCHKTTETYAFKKYQLKAISKNREPKVVQI
jgi:5-methylcytosine-specific restriction endonuclease McrA